MGRFSSDKEVYARIGRLLTELCADERAGAQLQRADTIVQYRLRDPQATLTLKALAGQDRQVDLGDTRLRPEVVVLMDGDTAHDYWAGELNVAVALADGRIRPRGPSAKILALVPMLKLAIPRYRELMEQPLELPEEEPAAEEQQGDPEAPPEAGSEPAAEQPAAAEAPAGETQQPEAEAPVEPEPEEPPEAGSEAPAEEPAAEQQHAGEPAAEEAQEPGSEAPPEGATEPPSEAPGSPAQAPRSGG